MIVRTPRPDGLDAVLAVMRAHDTAGMRVLYGVVVWERMLGDG
jgi:hypothetical protein